MKAVIMAGGEGTRLRPLTVNRPKPMVPLCDRPLLEYTIDLLRKYGFNDITMTLHYLPRVVMDHFEDGSSYGVKIEYSIEDRPLGTAGGVKKALDEIDETVLVFSGDILTDVDLGTLLRFHKRTGAWVTMALTKVKYPTEYGIALLNEESRIVKYLEKPSWSEVFSDYANMGIYIVEPEALKMIPRGREFDFSNDLFPKMLREDKPIYGWIAHGYYWSDVGNPEEYLKANLDILRGNVSTSLLAQMVRDGVWIAEDAVIDPEAEIYPPAYIGRNVRIDKKTKIAESVISSNSIIGENSVIESSVIWGGTFLGAGSRVNASIIGSSCKLDTNVFVGEGAIIGDECRIGAGAVIRPNVYIWPSKYIEPYSIVTSHLRWGFGAKRRLFSEWGIEGIVNSDMTPELALKIGLAIGSWIRSGNEIAVARDTFRPSRVIKRALIAGLMASGIRVRNLQVAPSPVLRHYQLNHKLPASIMTSTSLTKADVVKVKLLDKDGLPPSLKDEKKIERIIFREEFLRAQPDSLGSNIYVQGHIEDYIDYLLKHFDVKLISKERPLIVVDCSFGSSSFVAPALFERIGVEALLLNVHTGGDIPTRSSGEVHRYVTRLASIVKIMNASLGLMFDEDADKILLVDDKGRSIAGDEAIAVMVKMALEVKGKGKIVVSSTSSRVIEKIAQQYGAKVERVPYGIRGIARGSSDEEVIIAGDERGAFIIPPISQTPDGFASALFIVEYLVSSGMKLSELIDSLPKSSMAHREVPLSFGKRGAFLRTLLDNIKENVVDTMDGLKLVEDRGWVHIHPRTHEPIIDLIAEADTPEDAELLVRKYLTVVQSVLS